MTEYKMLGEFVHFCTKCQLNLNHRITLMDGSEPARVLCLTCHSERKFRNSRGKSEKTTRVARAPVTSKDKAKVQSGSQNLEWRRLISENNHLARSYNMNEAFALHDVVKHPTFGLGLVVGFDHPDKVRLFFDGDVKVLRGKKAA